MSPTFRVGDRVQFPLGRGRVDGVITEDRGAIGFRGRHLYTVLVPMDPFEPTTFEMSADELEPINKTATPAALSKAMIVDYLVHGGLIAILSNSSGGRSQPRVWLRPDSLGNVTHTYAEERGVVGGGFIPVMAVHNERIFEPKRAAVLSLLQSFGLDDSEAKRVIASIGIAP